MSRILWVIWWTALLILNGAAFRHAIVETGSATGLYLNGPCTILCLIVLIWNILHTEG